jgi:Caspase domain
MKKALISIGIGKTDGSLLPLKGAVQDARDFSDWGQRQGFDTTLLIDDKHKIRAADAYEALKAYLDAGSYSQVVVYFSGHGILQAPDCELWLMSGAPSNPNEVINVRASMSNARYCGLEHVVFISDACRTLPTDMRQATVGLGSALLPYMGIHSPSSELDVYYATLPGDSALEISLDEAVKRDRGLFTSCLLDALSGKVGDVLENLNVSGVMNRVVPGRPLKIWLGTAVPLAAEKESIVLRQKPEIRIESDNSRFLARFDSNHQPSSASPPLDQRHHIQKQFVRDENRQRLVPSRGTRANLMTRTPLPRPTQPTTRSRTSNFASQLARDLAMARSLDADIAVFGGAPETGFWAHGHLESSSHDGTFLLHLRDAEESGGRRKTPMKRTLALAFEDKICVPLNALEGYITTVHFEGSRVVAINYVVKASPLGPGYVSPISDSDMDSLRVEAAVLARQGQLSVGSDPIRAYAERPSLYQALDPVLGTLAAYSYARAGLNQELSAIVDELRQSGLSIPFDVELLTSSPTSLEYPAAAPGMPMLTEGWLLLGLREKTMPAPLLRARPYLLPSLWATFSSPATDSIHRYLSGV